MVEVQFDFIGGAAHGFVAGELELLDEVLVGILGHFSALVGVEEDVVHVEGSRHERLLVGGGDTESLVGAQLSGGGVEGVDGPKTLADRTDVEVEFDFVVLQGDEGKCETWVSAKPEEERDVECGFGERVAGSANLVWRAVGGTWTLHVGEVWVGDIGQTGGVADHFEVRSLLLGGESELVPDVHPVAVLAIDALTADLHLNLRDQLLADIVQPACEHARLLRGGST